MIETKDILSRAPSQVEEFACGICLSSCKDENRVKLKLCEHAFHSKCVNSLASANNKHCPQCRILGN